MRSVALALAFGLVCAGAALAGTQRISPTSGIDPEMQAECEAQGGQVVVGMAGPTCGLPQPDAGKACTSSEDCEGFCLAESRSCSPITPFFGCHELYEGGGDSVTICID